MAEEFDSGPLSWVKDEINQALDTVMVNVQAMVLNPDDLSTLRASQTHLYQVSGALDMVGLEGCKRFCAELEKLIAKFEKQQINPSAELLADLEIALSALKNYLQDLMNGMPDVPLRLYSVLKPLVIAQGEVMDESELFFPDTTQQAPKDLETKSLSDVTYANYIIEQRVNYQKSLVAWLQKKQASDLDNMRLAIENVTQVQDKSAQKTLWWAATAFAESLNDEKVWANPGAMRLCRRLDQQLRITSEGSAKPHGNLLKDILYYVALSDTNSASLDKVRAVFELDQLLPSKASVNTQDNVFERQSKLINADKQLAISQLITRLDHMKHLWQEAVEQGFSNHNNEVFTAFCNDAEALVQSSQPLANLAINNYFTALYQAALAIKNGQNQQDPEQLPIVQIEIAAAIQLAEHTLINMQFFNAETQQKLLDSSKRLQALAVGEALSELVISDKLERDTLSALVAQIKGALKSSEQALDLFFRQPSNQAPLAQAVKPLQQVAAAFDILNLATPMAIAKADLALVNYFSEASYTVNQAQFELLAESLSMLELYVDELPKPRPQSDAALKNALERLTAEHSTRGLKLAENASIVSETSNTSAAESDDLDNPATAYATSSLTSASSIDAELLEVFLIEAEDVIGQNAQNLQTLRVNNTDVEAMGDIRRGFHTLKGSGRTVGLNDLGNVAGFVETMLNGVIERKTFLQADQLGFLEQTTAAFATWAAELKDSGVADVDVDEWQQKVNLIVKPKANYQIEEVVIGGTRKMSRGLYNVFLQEAQQNLSLLQADVTGLSENSNAKNSTLKPNEIIKRAVHTLASNALTAGFKPMGELGRALENWLDEYQGSWTNETLVLYKKTVKSLSDMCDRAAKLMHPRAAPALVKALKYYNFLSPALTLHEAPELDSDKIELDDNVSPDVESYATLSVSSSEASAGLIEETPAVETTANDVPSEVLEPEDVLSNRHSVEIVPLVENLIPSPSPIHVSVVDNELLCIFIEEARELIPQMGSELRAWNSKPQDVELPDALQRSLHTLKGSARMAGQVNLGDTVHELEDQVIRALKRKVAHSDFENMFVALDSIGNLFDAAVVVSSIPANSALEPNELTTAMQLEALPTRSAQRNSQYLRLRADVLDRLINEAGEISIARSRMDREMQGFKGFSLDLTESVMRLRNYLRELEIEADTQLQSRLSILQEANEAFDPLEFDRFTRLQELTRMMAESVNDVATIQHGLIMNLDQTESALQQQNRMNRELQQALLNIRMLPFSLLTERLYRIVRQTSRELNKQVDLIIEGEAIELDRSVLDKIGAPLEHLLRNAVAHGIESPEERKNSGKEATGNITVKVRQENDEIVLLVSDNGRGVPLARVKAKAVQNGLIAENTEISDQALMAIIFEPGFSTASELSQISGRGVGLDSVRSDISGLGGRIDVDSVTNQSTVFTIYIPVTLSVAQVLIVRAGADKIALPVTMIEQAQKIKPQQLTGAYAAGGIEWGGKHYAIRYLSKLIGLNDAVPETHNYTSVLLLRSGSYHIALHVDEILGNQEVVMKPIGSQLSRAPGLVGATVTGDGHIVLIMNPVQLANREVLSVGSVKVQVTKGVQPQTNTTIKNSVMVVDDSLTMRKVLGRLLEREGFDVIIAKDGMDALQLLQDVTPDIILTDIEMPRMDGFGLVRNIRDDIRTKNTPVVMISSRTAEKHRSVATELGVNAFFGKPVPDDELVAKINELLKLTVLA
ncbi:MAG: Hpt domain-containing protein [Methylophilaceae bacterium]|nr:Hpt domain-containing protein [Methylophilaceae bacterium]